MGHRSCSFVKIGETTEWRLVFELGRTFYGDIYIYIHIFLYTTGTVCICLYATKMRAPFKESVVQKFPFFWGEWLYITQIKVDIYQAKGSFLVKIGEEKTTQMVGMEREIIFLPWQWRAE